LNYLEATDLDYFYNLEGTSTLSGIPLGTSQQVNFSQLDPGNYTLEIYSENKNGQKNAKSDTLHFVIEAPFWRMPWFYLLMTLMAAFLGWLLFYWRYQNKLKQLKAVDQVRKNISEDFHDELGSKLSIISMYSEFTKQELNKENSKASVYLDKVNDTASRLYENTRDLIWALNPQHDSLYDLFLQLKDFGEEMFQDTNIDFHSAGLAEMWKNKNLPMRYKRHLLLIFKEAMHNALKHSGCRNIRLSIDEKDEKLIIMLQDDGEGFDTTLENKGDGLKNMAHRAIQMQSELHIISKKEGTRIWVELPFSVLKQTK
jgi:signal transduction histidine kinase